MRGVFCFRGVQDLDAQSISKLAMTVYEYLYSDSSLRSSYVLFKLSKERSFGMKYLHKIIFGRYRIYLFLDGRHSLSACESHYPYFSRNDAFECFHKLDNY